MWRRWFLGLTRPARLAVAAAAAVVLLVGYPAAQIVLAASGAGLLIRLVALLPLGVLAAEAVLWVRRQPPSGTPVDVLDSLGLGTRDKALVKNIVNPFRRSLPERLHPAARAYATQELEKGKTPWPRLLLSVGVVAWLLLTLVLAIDHDVASTLFLALEPQLADVYQSRSTRRWRRALADPRRTGTP